MNAPIELKQLRENVEKIDSQLIQLLAARQSIVKQIGYIKKQNGNEIKDVTRETQLIRFHEDLTRQYGLDITFINQLFEMIMNHSRSLQKKD